MERWRRPIGPVLQQQRQVPSPGMAGERQAAPRCQHLCEAGRRLSAGSLHVVQSELGEKLAKMYDVKDPKCIFVFGLKTQVRAPGRSGGFAPRAGQGQGGRAGRQEEEEEEKEEEESGTEEVEEQAPRRAGGGGELAGWRRTGGAALWRGGRSP